MARRKRIQLSRQFVRESWQLISENKRLYWLQFFNLLVSSILVLGVIFDIIWPLLMAGDKESEVVSGIQIGIGVVLLVLIPIVSNLFNAAIIFFCYDKIEGKASSLGKSVGKALRFWPRIISWSMLQILVGTIMNIIDNGHETLANIVIDMVVGVAWALLSFFVMPVMLIENKNVFAAIKESVGIVKDIWGKRAIISLGVVALIFFVLFLVGIGAIYLSIHFSGVWTPFVIGLSVVYLIAVAYTRRLMITVVRLKLYMAVRSGVYSDAF